MAQHIVRDTVQRTNICDGCINIVNTDRATQWFSRLYMCMYIRTSACLIALIRRCASVASVSVL